MPRPMADSLPSEFTNSQIHKQKWTPKNSETSGKKKTKKKQKKSQANGRKGSFFREGNTDATANIQSQSQSQNQSQCQYCNTNYQILQYQRQSMALWQCQRSLEHNNEPKLPTAKFATVSRWLPRHCHFELLPNEKRAKTIPFFRCLSLFFMFKNGAFFERRRWFVVNQYPNRIPFFVVFFAVFFLGAPIRLRQWCRYNGVQAILGYDI